MPGGIPGAPPGYTAPGTKNTPGVLRSAEKQKLKDKRKAEKAARKKNRKR